MLWKSCLSSNADANEAINDRSGQLLAALGTQPHLIFVFASEHYRADFVGLTRMLRHHFPAACVLGCSANGVVGAGHEVEQQRALSITAAVLPDVTIDCWHLEADGLGPDTEHSARCNALLERAPSGAAQFIVLADPFSFPTAQLLSALDLAFPAGTVVGGLASGGQARGEIALFVDEQVCYSGAVVLALEGNIDMLTAIAQGCRPIGEPMFVSACNGAKLTALDGRPSLDVLHELFERADAGDRALMQRALFIGIAMRAGESRYAQGDYLVRNVAGTDAEHSAIWVGAELRENQVVQFHIRDAATSAADLERCLTKLSTDLADNPPSGGLLFSCSGRGQGLYGRPDHDIGAFHTRIGELPLGGFFCNGEIGPVSGASFIHAYTSAFALFRPRLDHS